MIHHSSDMTEAELTEYDVCIIGSGPAGIVVCAEMLYSGARVCVLESGSFEPSPFTDQMRAVESRGLHIPDNARERAFGGATKTWGGICTPMDPIDFEKRPLSSHEGWPFSYQDIIPYLEASARYSFPHLASFQHDDSSPLSWREIERKIYMQQHEPIRFGRKFRYIFERAGIDLILDLTAISLETTKKDGALAAESVLCKRLDGTTMRIRSRVFVLAAGGIENPRILLNSKGQLTPNGLGNDHDQVGRYLMNHPWGYAATLQFNMKNSAWKHFLKTSGQEYRIYRGFHLSENTQREGTFLNDAIEACLVFPWQELKALRRYGAARYYILSYLRTLKRRQWRQASKDVLPIFLSSLKMLPSIVELPRYLFERLVYKNRLLFRSARIRMWLEMEPRPENRVTLGNTADALGMPVAQVEHSLSEHDLASAEALLATFEKECTALGIGRVTREAGALSSRITGDAKHHMGTTRMGLDPKSSVVDRDLRVHSVSNVYVAGTSVFSTSGCANPTMTMVALSIRLAEHLRSLFQERAPLRISPQESNARPVIIIGAGGRIARDVVPILEAQANYRIAEIFAHREGSLFGIKNAYPVQSLSTITESAIAQADVLYVAVPFRCVEEVLARVTKYPCSHIDLIVDTPAVASNRLRAFYAKFRGVHIAEDSAFLPWFDVVVPALREDGAIGPLKKIMLNQSAYRYHAMALVKALCSRAGVSSCRYRGIHFLRRVLLIGSRGIRATVVEPYDPSRGTIEIVGARGVASSHSKYGYTKIECLEKDGRCIGFRLGKHRAQLTPTETELIGPWKTSDTIVTRMADLKRVGLYRLFRALHAGYETWSLANGLYDVAISERAVIF